MCKCHKNMQMSQKYANFTKICKLGNISSNNYSLAQYHFNVLKVLWKINFFVQI